MTQPQFVPDDSAVPDCVFTGVLMSELHEVERQVFDIVSGAHYLDSLAGYLMPAGVQISEAAGFTDTSTTWDIVFSQCAAALRDYEWIVCPGCSQEVPIVSERVGLHTHLGQYPYVRIVFTDDTAEELS